MQLKHLFALCLITLVIGAWTTASAQTDAAPGEVKSENTSGQHVGIERAYSQLRFDRPVYLTGAGDGSRRLFVVEQAGIVRSFKQDDESPVANVFLDISDRISRQGKGWESATYVWDQGGTEAELHIGGKQFEYWNQGMQSWHAPSSSECAACHVDAAGYLLGLNTAQLNRDSDGSNQISKWAKAGVLDMPADLDLSKAPQYCSPFDQNADLETRARVYLDVNCAMCHQPNGPGNAIIDLRYATDLKSTKTLDIKPAQGDLGIADARLIAPGSPERSLMLKRIETKSVGRMPSIGSNVVDEEAVNLLRQWIKSLEK